MAAFTRALKCLLAALFMLSTACPSHAAGRKLSEMSMAERFGQWMAQHGRAYEDAAEKERRFEIFKSNAELIDSFNAGKHSYWLAVNKFADMTNEEFTATHTGFKKSVCDDKPSSASDSKLAPNRGFRYDNVNAIPASMDWRTKGAVTPVKDQGQCGCCWAFSAVAAMEGITKLTTGKLVSISEQELVDCDVHGEDQGCNGGLMDDAFKFIIKNGGLASESGYPYTAADGTCSAKKSSPVAAVISGFEDVPANNEAALQKAVAKQPVSVAIEASGFAFQFYSGGVFTGPCGTNLDHGVTAVGYGASGGTKYWLVKNSWGSSWGESGYIRMERGVDAKEGLCGIAMEASYPTASTFN